MESRRWIATTGWTLAILLGLATGIVVQRLWVLRADVEELAQHLVIDHAPESTLVYDANDELVSAVYEEHRIAVPLDKISPHAVNAFIAIEDKRFFRHHGLDYRRILKSAFVNLRAGEIVQGGSTITQQLVRSVLLSREQTYARKLKEAVLARRLEERYSKQQILEAYLNRVYFGHGYYGIEAAALGYFGKPAAQLNAVEAATLAGLIKGPAVYSPTKAPELARERRNLVLVQMHAQGLLSEDLQAARAAPIEARANRPEVAPALDPRQAREAGYFRDVVHRELIERFGADAVYTGGLRVYTTLDPRLQALAEEAIASRLRTIPRARDISEPLQGALVAIEPRTGFVRAIVGGRDFDESPFNRAVDARRQPGSAFKPFIFAMALESGFLPSSQIDGLDQPIETREGPWLPAGEHEQSSVRLRDALALSSNRAAAHLLQDVGIRRTLDLVSRFGITSPMPMVPSVALGTGEMTLLELTAAYGVFANRGVLKAPVVIRRVDDSDGHVIYRAPAGERGVISDATAYMMTSMMADVVNHGTATTARSAGYLRKAAGKTGTSNDYTDAWFVGYTPEIVTGVWFGYDTPHAIMNRGFAGVVAVPAWARFMTAAAGNGGKETWFERPGSVVPVKLCRISGMLATDRCHLPVLDTVLEHPGDPNTAVQTIVQEGGVFEDLRHIGRTPDPCLLQHGDYRTFTDAIPTSTWSAEPPAGADVIAPAAITRRPPPELPRPFGPTPGQMIPGALEFSPPPPPDVPSSIRGQNISKPVPIPPRPPGGP